MLSTPDIHDKNPDIKVITDFIHYGGVASFSGPISTVECFEDNSLVKTQLSTSSDGGVLVISGGKSKNVALLGDNIALMAKNNGWKGIVVDGYIRDVEILADIKVGIMALGACPRKSKKENKGRTNVPIFINDIKINPGNWLYADSNGILISEDKLET
tara:strand:+ start:111 stop:584 length:474 start_codon:yes stop_codon:yes gene_type:complete